MAILLVDEASLKVIKAHNRSWNNSVNYLGVLVDRLQRYRKIGISKTLSSACNSKLRINFNLFSAPPPPPTTVFQINTFRVWMLTHIGFTLYADLANHVANSLAINWERRCDISSCTIHIESTRIESIILFNLSDNPVFRSGVLASYWFHFTWNITVLRSTGASSNRVSFLSFQSARKYDGNTVEIIFFIFRTKERKYSGMI